MRTIVALVGVLMLAACRATPTIDPSTKPSAVSGVANHTTAQAPIPPRRAPVVPPSPALAAAAVEPQPKFEPLSDVGNHSPYRVGDQTYTVMAAAGDYVERGQASWYGPNFHGKLTSNQEVFDQHKLTAAHKTLPLPSYVQVTNLDNQRQVIVRVNDRGPFKPGRIIDLSYAAALKLDIVDQGIGNVEVRAIRSDGDDRRPAIATAKNTYLQLGAFGSRDNAMNALRQLPYEGAHVSSAERDGKLLHFLRIGPLESAEQAEQLKPRLAADGFPESRLIFE